MTEQEFVSELAKIGYTDAEIDELIWTINLMKNKGENVAYEDLLPFAIEAHNECKNFPDDILSFE
jgi:hypothetical protein